MVFDIRQQRQHQAVAVHNARARRKQRRHALQRGLKRQRLVTRQHLQIAHPVGRSMLGNPSQLRTLRLGRRHDQLTATPVRNTALLAIGIQQRLACHAQPGFERTLRIVDTRMYHLAVARRSFRANRIRGFQHQYVTPTQSQCPSHCQAHHARADDDAIHFFSHENLPEICTSLAAFSVRFPRCTI